MNWSAYVGLPWRASGRDRSGVDCWGAVVLVFAEQHGVALPSYIGDYESPDEQAETAGLFTDRDAWPWRQAAPEQPFDVAVFRVGALPSHCGIVVRPGRMLHIHGGGFSRMEDYRSGLWARRLLGFYRHAELGG